MGEGRARWARHEVAVDGEVLHVESSTPVRDGDDRPPLVLCHGLGGSHAVWYQQVAHFARHRRVITWDARGFGLSTNSGGNATVVTAAKDLRAVLDALDVQAAHVVGQSMGGWTALGFTRAHPTRVRSLTLTNSLAGIGSERWAAGVSKAPPPSTDTFVGEHAALGPALVRDDPAKAFLYQQLGGTRTPPPEAMRSLLTTHVDGAVLGWMTAPVLVIGSSDDTIFPVPLLVDVVGHLPVARFEVVEGAGHSTYYERPEVWNSLVESFLADVDAEEAS